MLTCPLHASSNCVVFFEVYDVSKFVSRHPGGMEQIMMGAGRDVTQLFESYHSFDIYKYVLRNVQLYAIMGCIFIITEFWRNSMSGN